MQKSICWIELGMYFSSRLHAWTEGDVHERWVTHRYEEDNSLNMYMHLERNCLILEGLAPREFLGEVEKCKIL